jgi:hypothetical protein
MLSRRFLFTVVCLTGFAAVADQAAADVNGQTYPVRVRAGFRNTYLDVFLFTNDSGNPNEGPFTSAAVGTGRWEQTIMGSIAFWSASYSDGDGLRIDASGVQLGTSLFGMGETNKGDTLLITPAPITPR